MDALHKAFEVCLLSLISISRATYSSSRFQEPQACLMAQTQPDIEMQESRKRVFVNGYPTLADFIARDKERSTSIYRSYHRLTSRNLLYLEAELFELEKRQDELDEQDLKGDLDAKQYARDWSVLSTSDDERCVERRKLLTMSRAKIKEYRKSYLFPFEKCGILGNRTCPRVRVLCIFYCGGSWSRSDAPAEDALIAQETILKMIKPHRRTVEAFQSWMEGEADGRNVPVITGLSANRLVDASDLIALHPPVDQDWLTRFIRRYFRILFVVRCSSERIFAKSQNSSDNKTRKAKLKAH